MKKWTGLIFALALLLFIFAACGDSSDQNTSPSVISNTADTPDTADELSDDKAEDTVSDTQVSDGIPELVKPWEQNPLNGGYISAEAEALVTVTKAYLARRIWLQYDCSRLMADVSGHSKVTRPQYHVNSPEDCSSQNTGYTNCSAFTYDVYWETFGLDIKASGTNALRDAVDMHVFTYYITGKETPYERRLVEQNFLNSLQQGDIIACDHPAPRGGHALMYIGDGMMIDSAYFSSKGGGDYDHSKNHDNTEVEGSVRTREVMSFFEEDNYYYFWNEECWSVVRPLKKYPDAKITYNTQKRVENLKDIYVEKRSSHTLGQSVDIGEEITFTFYIRNDRDTDATLNVTAQVPDNTEYVSGGDKTIGKTIKWTVDVQAGKDIEVSYTIRVNHDASLYGTYISGERSSVGGVDVKCRNIYVAKHLNENQKRSLITEVYSIDTVSQTGTELAEQLYKAAGMEIDLAPTDEMLNSLFVKYGNSAKHYALNTQSEYIGLVAPSMYGGYYCTTSELFAGDRTYGIFGNQIYTGDILLAQESGKVYSYMCVSDNKLLDLDTGKILYNIDAKEKLLSLLGRDVFVTLRPGTEL